MVLAACARFALSVVPVVLPASAYRDSFNAASILMSSQDVEGGNTTTMKDEHAAIKRNVFYTDCYPDNNWESNTPVGEDIWYSIGDSVVVWSSFEDPWLRGRVIQIGWSKSLGVCVKVECERPDHGKQTWRKPQAAVSFSEEEEITQVRSEHSRLSMVTGWSNSRREWIDAQVWSVAGDAVTIQSINEVSRGRIWRKTFPLMSTHLKPQKVKNQYAIGDGVLVKGETVDWWCAGKVYSVRGFFVSVEYSVNDPLRSELERRTLPAFSDDIKGINPYIENGRVSIRSSHDRRWYVGHVRDLDGDELRVTYGHDDKIGYRREWRAFYHHDIRPPPEPDWNPADSAGNYVKGGSVECVEWVQWQLSTDSEVSGGFEWRAAIVENVSNGHKKIEVSTSTRRGITITEWEQKIVVRPAGMANALLFQDARPHRQQQAAAQSTSSALSS